MAARLLRLWVRILSGAWKCVSCKCCVLSGRGLCDEQITRPEESCRLWWVVECDLENLVNEEAMAHWGLLRQIKKKGIKKHRSRGFRRKPPNSKEDSPNEEINKDSDG